MDETTDGELSVKRDRSPSFPYLKLSAAIDLAKKLHGAAKQSEVRLSSIAPAWNTTPASGALMKYAAALQAYGLIESSGSNQGRKVRLTDSARRILEDTRPGVKESLGSEAALKPRLIAELFSQWGRNRPVDDIAKSALQFDYNFTPDATRRFLGVFDEALEFIIESRDPVERTTLEEQADRSDPSLSSDDKETQSPKNDSQKLNLSYFSQPNSSPSLEMRHDIFTLDEGEVTITLPKKMSLASFNDFCDWLELVKRKVSRSVSSD